MKRAAGQLTIRGMDPEIQARVAEIARREGISLNQAVLRLLRKAAGVGGKKGEGEVIGDALDHLAGTWTAEEEAEFNEAVAVFEDIDGSVWGA